MLQEYPNMGQISENKSSARIEIYFICKDASAIFQAVSLRGISTAETFVGNNMWVIGLIDPDGIGFYLIAPRKNLTEHDTRKDTKINVNN